eukprot:6172327-Pleurochrysis_carterae.AAC.3
MNAALLRSWDLHVAVRRSQELRLASTRSDHAAELPYASCAPGAHAARAAHAPSCSTARHGRTRTTRSTAEVEQPSRRSARRRKRRISSCTIDDAEINDDTEN